MFLNRKRLFTSFGFHYVTLAIIYVYVMVTLFIPGLFKIYFVAPTGYRSSTGYSCKFMGSSLMKVTDRLLLLLKKMLIE